MNKPVNKHAKSLIAATALFPRQMDTSSLFDIMRAAAAELDRLDTDLAKANATIERCKDEFREVI